MARQYRLGTARRIVNTVMSAAVMLRVPRRSVLLETVGAKSGQVRRTPVNVLVLDDTRWLVAPYGMVSWVHNVRAAPQTTLRRGLVGEPVRLEPVDAQTAGPVLKAYVEAFPITRPFFDAGPSAPQEAYAAEAARHPVFRVVPVDPDGKRAI